MYSAQVSAISKMANSAFSLWPVRNHAVRGGALTGGALRARALASVWTRLICHQDSTQTTKAGSHALESLIRPVTPNFSQRRATQQEP